MIEMIVLEQPCAHGLEICEFELKAAEHLAETGVEKVDLVLPQLIVCPFDALGQSLKMHV
jgi:hypothetical protein